MHKRPLAVIAVFFILGIVLGRFLPDSVRLFHVFVVTLILITLTLTLSLKRERGNFGPIPPLGMKVLPRTVTIEQDNKLREMAEKTGRKISELVREAVEEYNSYAK